MKVGLIDVDGHNFPNLPLMKLSAFHKAQGDSVEWYSPTASGHMDKVYMSKVFSFTEDYLYPIDADDVSKGGSGYCISLVDGKEVYDKNKDTNLPDEIEHIYPDYSLYGTDKAYGFITRGCPRGCEFCHVATKEGKCSRKVADVTEFWKDQKDIVLLDPNILAYSDSEGMLEQLRDTKARIEFNQGLDIRMMTEQKAKLLRSMKLNLPHFAWDRAEDDLEDKFRMFKEVYGKSTRGISVYVLCHYNTTIEQDLHRIYTLRSMNYSPYVMLYDKESTERGDIYRKLQRWVNNRFVFWKCPTFEEYDASVKTPRKE